MGGDGSTSTDASLFKCVKDGLVIKHDKKIYTKPSLNYPYIVFQASDIPGIKPEDLLTDHDVLLRELAAQRAEITDLRQKLDRVLELLEPQVIEKPRLKFP